MTDEEKKELRDLIISVTIDKTIPSGTLFNWIEQKKKEWEIAVVDNMGMKQAIEWWLHNYRGIEHLAEGGKTNPETMYTISTILGRCYKKLYGVLEKEEVE